MDNRRVPRVPAPAGDIFACAVASTTWDPCHVTRTTIPSVLATVAILALSPWAPGSARASDTPLRTPLVTLQRSILIELNDVRAAHGLAPLVADDNLTEAADYHSIQMLSLGYFSHRSANGAGFGQRMERFYSSSGFGYWSVGENLLWGAAHLDAREAIEMWMASPEHRANILRADWREVGISAIRDTSAPGTFGGSSVTLVTTDFGVRLTR